MKMRLLLAGGLLLGLTGCTTYDYVGGGRGGGAFGGRGAPAGADGGGEAGGEGGLGHGWRIGGHGCQEAFVAEDLAEEG